MTGFHQDNDSGLSAKTQSLVESFVEEHGCTDSRQVLILLEEQGELAAAVLRDDEMALCQEIGDVLFTLRGFLAAYDTSAEDAFRSYFGEPDGFDAGDIAASAIEGHSEGSNESVGYVSTLSDAVSKIVRDALLGGEVRMSLVGKAMLVTHSLAAANGIDGETWANISAVQNSKKDGSTDGDKVT